MGTAPPRTTREERLPFSPAVGCLLSVLLGLVCAAACFALLWVSDQGQFVYAPDPFRVTRVWILRGVEGRGLAVSTTRPLPTASADETCTRTTVRFYFTGRAVPGADTEYCECYVRDGSSWVPSGPCGED